jgi:hypothetical protein
MCVLVLLYHNDYSDFSTDSDLVRSWGPFASLLLHNLNMCEVAQDKTYSVLNIYVLVFWNMTLMGCT